MLIFQSDAWTDVIRFNSHAWKTHLLKPLNTTVTVVWPSVSMLALVKKAVQTAVINATIPFASVKTFQFHRITKSVKINTARSIEIVQLVAKRMISSAFQTVIRISIMIWEGAHVKKNALTDAPVHYTHANLRMKRSHLFLYCTSMMVTRVIDHYWLT